MKSVLISIKPEWCEKIASGKKTVEVRKTRPKMETPFKCYIYCTTAKMWEKVSGSMMLCFDELYRHPQEGIKYGCSEELMLCDDYSSDNFLNGKVIGEFVCDSIEEFTVDYRGNDEQNKRISEQSCVSLDELIEYQGERQLLYAWHISDLVIYEQPKELSEYYIPCKEYFDSDRPQCGACPWEIPSGGESGSPQDCGCEGHKPILRPPQSWCYVEEERNV